MLKNQVAVLLIIFVEIYFEAVRKGRYTSYIAKDTYMDMMYMDDAIDAIIKLMEADSDKLVTRNGYNLSAMSFEPEQIKVEIQKHYPGFALDYEVDPVRQAIAIVGQIILIQAILVKSGALTLNTI